MAQLRGRWTHLTGICNNQLQWCQNPEIEHGGTTTGPARRGAKPNGGWESDVTPPVGKAAGPHRVPDAARIGSWLTLPPPPSASLNRMALAIQSGCPAPVPVSRVRPAKAQPTFAPVPTPRVEASTRQMPAPVSVPWRRTAEQPPLSPPAQPNPVDSVPEEAALPELGIRAPEGLAQPELVDSVQESPAHPELEADVRESPAQPEPEVRVQEGTAHQLDLPRFYQRPACGGVLRAGSLQTSAHVRNCCANAACHAAEPTHTCC